MKAKVLSLGCLLVLVAILSSCVKEGPAGKDGKDGNANVIYSSWYSPAAWDGKTGDWFFQVANSDLSQDVVEAGVILAYTSLNGDIYPAAVRPLPAYALGANWDFLIPDYGLIEFTSTSLAQPATNGNYFRFVVIPSTFSMKSTGTTLEQQLKSMTYLEVCKRYGIPE